MSATPKRRPDAACPLRPGFACNLCHPEAKEGPQDCPTVAIVMDDPLLRDELARVRAAHRALTAGVVTPPEPTET